MLEVEVTEGGVRAVDDAGATVQATADWVALDCDGPLSQPADAAVAGVVTSVSVPADLVRLDRPDDGVPTVIDTGAREESIDLSPASYNLLAESVFDVSIRFEGAATLDAQNRVATLTFAGPTRVDLGFRDRSEATSEPVTVPPTPDGVARALSSLGVNHPTSTPDRSFPTMRGRPPRIEFGNRVSTPEGGTSGVELRLPRDLSYLVPVSTLAYYLGASVTVEPGATPSLRTPDREYELAPLPTFQADVASLLRRVFVLDCLVRTVGPYAHPVEESSLLETVDLDADRLYAADVATRVQAYLDAPFERVSSHLPEWHLSMYLDPRPASVEALPHLLRDVPHVFLPAAKSLRSAERLSRCLDDFYRVWAGDAPSIDLLEPDLGTGRAHGWLADGVPIDVFKSTPEAYEHRTRYRERADDPISVVAVLNDSRMGREYEHAARIYRERAAEADIDVAVYERLRTGELADVFAAEHDLVHFIGHCEKDGLRCVDGHLSAETLAESNAQTFFLNACGSFYEGLELVRRGSVAGAVTFDKVLDNQATRVGTTFVRLLINGFCIERALDLARRRIMMGKDYAVVGDGTHRLVQSDTQIPAEATLEAEDDETFRLSYTVHSPGVGGGQYRPRFWDDHPPRLFGAETTLTLDRHELVTLFEREEIPVVYDGDIHWSDELCHRFD
ncbi:MAG: hypothetical protein ACQETI_01520 [Halobacteriota archaeon]